ncbi:MAG: ligase-associated DNA damage response endonuclease PdeM [Ferruginibacter sp.]
MSEFVNFKFRNNNFLLTSGRSIFWEEEKTLILSDVHLGKAGHFRKSGIAIPQAVFKEDMQRLVSQIQYFKPTNLLIVGDLFHSTANKEHEFFLKWRNDFKTIPIHLVKGNHDILKKEWYSSAGITVHDSNFSVSNISFTHDINQCIDNDKYCFSGHIHPGVRIRGIGKQLIQLPCFYFGKTYAVLPAFGKFTGTYPVEPKPGDSIFAVADNSVIKIH